MYIRRLATDGYFKNVAGYIKIAKFIIYIVNTLV